MKSSVQFSPFLVTLALVTLISLFASGCSSNSSPSPQPDAAAPDAPVGAGGTTGAGGSAKTDAIAGTEAGTGAGGTSGKGGVTSASGSAGVGGAIAAGGAQGIDAAASGTGGGDAGVTVRSEAGSGTDGSVADGQTISQADGGGGGTSTATMFISNNISGLVYRYAIKQGADPIMNGTISALPAGGTLDQSTATGMTITPWGELFVADEAAGTFYRFLSPLGTPTFNGILSVAGIVHMNNFQFVDNELWVPNVTAYCTDTPENLVRVSFDAQEGGSAAGTVTNGFIGADRMMLWVPATRDLYESQCWGTAPATGVDTIQHYRVATDHTVTALTPITGNGLNSPQGVAMTAWGELLVVNDGLNSNSLSRFLIDGQGNAKANGMITGNALNAPVDAAFTPWGELFVAGNGTISRFTFDSLHAAVANGTYQVAGPEVSYFGGWNKILIVPGASSSLGGQDAGVGSPSADAGDTSTTSCLKILQANPAATSGVYEINPGGNMAFNVYCDMTMAGGGWTILPLLFDNPSYWNITHPGNSCITVDILDNIGDYRQYQSSTTGDYSQTFMEFVPPIPVTSVQFVNFNYTNSGSQNSMDLVIGAVPSGSGENTDEAWYFANAAGNPVGFPIPTATVCTSIPGAYQAFAQQGLQVCSRDYGNTPAAPYLLSEAITLTTTVPNFNMAFIEGCQSTMASPANEGEQFNISVPPNAMGVWQNGIAVR
jgi:hypothetical protein